MPIIRKSIKDCIVAFMCVCVCLFVCVYVCARVCVCACPYAYVFLFQDLSDLTPMFGMSVFGAPSNS